MDKRRTDNTMDNRKRTDNTSKEEGQITHQKKKDR
jgi:hypothetical protein